MKSDVIVRNKKLCSLDPPLKGWDCASDLFNIDKYYRLSLPSKEALHKKIKCRALDPLMRTSQGLMPLSKLDAEYARIFDSTKEAANIGWWIERISDISQAANM